jgi:23S rRNA pseudouridine2604 synthase
MSRTTLKLPKPIDRNAARKPATSRARRAQKVQRQHGASAPPPVPAVTASSTPPASAPVTAASAPATARRPPTAPRRFADPKRAGPPKRAAAPKRAAPSERSATPQREATPPRFTAPTPRAPAPAVDRTEEPRLSKRMSELGLCSRREADEWIENGWVKVDGKVASTLGVRVGRDARIEIDPAAAKHQGEQVTILLHKPVGYVSGQPEDGHEPAMVLIRPENRWSEDPSPTQFRPGHLRGLAPAGRLDIDSTGLIVFTQDGRVARRLIGQDSDVEKEYLVRVDGTLDEQGLALLRHGMELDGVKLKPAKVSWSNEDQLRFVLREGRKRQIRRMCEMVGLAVTGLKRVRSGGVPLGPLPVGQWRYLRRGEKF